jgi:hypothetical protein
MPIYTQLFQYQVQALGFPPKQVWFPHDNWADFAAKKSFHAAYQQPFTIDPFPKVSTAYDQSINPDFAPDRRNGLREYYQQTTAFNPLPFVNFSYFNWLSDPVRTPPRLITGANQDFAYGSLNPIVSFSYFNWLSDPTRRVPIAEHKYEFSAYFTPAAAAFTTFWFNWLSEPVQTKAALPTGQNQDFAYGTYNPIIPSFGYFNWLSEPVRIRAFPASQQHAFTTDPFPRVNFSYFNWLSDPVRTPARLLTGANQDFAYGSFNPVVSFSYFNWLSDPTRRVPIAEHKYEFSAYFTPAAAFTTFWFNPLSEPTRRTGFPPHYSKGKTFFSTATPSTDFINQLSEPMRLKPIAEHKYEFSAYFTPTAVVTPSLSWFSPFSEPARRVGFPPHYSKGRSFFSTATPSIGFFNWLSEPVRMRVLATAQQQSLIYSGFTPAPPVSFWWYPLSEPTRRVGFPPHYSKGRSFFSVAIPTVDWAMTWSTPPQYMASWKTADNSVNFIAVIPNLSYFNHLSEPVRAKPGLDVTKQPFLSGYGSLNPTAPSFGYFNWLSEPVREKIGLQTRLQPTTVLGQPPILPSYGYFNQLSEPVRQKAGVLVGQQKDFIFGYTPTIPSFGYFNWLSEPVRQKVGLQVRLQSSAALGLPQIILSSLNATEQGDFLFGILQSFKVPIKALVDIVTFSPFLRPGVGPSVATQSPQRNISAIIEPTLVQQAGIVPPAAGGRVAIIVFKP